MLLVEDKPDVHASHLPDSLATAGTDTSRRRHEVLYSLSHPHGGVARLSEIYVLLATRAALPRFLPPSIPTAQCPCSG